MKKFVFVLLLLSFLKSELCAQVINRYPFIQSPSQSSAIIAWRRATSAIGTVKWGTSATSLSNTLVETSATQIHAVTISGLQPNTKYYYQALSDTFTSSVEYFYTAKPDSVRQLDFLVYGDCGFNNTQQDGIAAQMAAKTSEFALVVGDVDRTIIRLTPNSIIHSHGAMQNSLRSMAMTAISQAARSTSGWKMN